MEEFFQVVLLHILSGSSGFDRGHKAAGLDCMQDKFLTEPAKPERLLFILSLKFYVVNCADSGS